MLPVRPSPEEQYTGISEPEKRPKSRFGEFRNLARLRGPCKVRQAFLNLRTGAAAKRKGARVRPGPAGPPGGPGRLRKKPGKPPKSSFSKSGTRAASEAGRPSLTFRWARTGARRNRAPVRPPAARSRARPGSPRGAKWRFRGMRKSLRCETPGTSERSTPVRAQSKYPTLDGPSPGGPSGAFPDSGKTPEVRAGRLFARFLPAFRDSRRTSEGPGPVPSSALGLPLTVGLRTGRPAPFPGAPAVPARPPSLVGFGRFWTVSGASQRLGKPAGGLRSPPKASLGRPGAAQTGVSLHGSPQRRVRTDGRRRRLRAESGQSDRQARHK